LIRAVPDTNVWVAGIRWRGNAYEVIRRGETRACALVCSNEILHELMRVLRQYFGFSDDQAYEWYVRINLHCDVIQVTIRLNAVENDPDDNKFVECAVAGNCDFIVSRDKHLLDLGCYGKIEIVGVEQFLEILDRETTE